MPAAEGSFPRGRVSQKPAVEVVEEKKKKKKRKKPENHEKTADFLFGTAPATSSTSTSSSTRKRAKTKSVLPLGGGGVIQPTKKGEAYLEGLTFHKLGKGFKLLGVVREVQDDVAIVSLPYMWTGYVLRSGKGSQPLSFKETLHVGQLVPVAVLKATQETVQGGGVRRRIQVSIQPAAVNPAELQPSLTVSGLVVSVQDHGVLVDLGLGRQGFLKFENVAGAYTTDEEEEEVAGEVHKLAPNRLLSVNIQAVNEAGVFSLELPSAKARAKQYLPPATPNRPIPTLADLQPGCLVRAKVERLVKNGICVSFGDKGIFQGAIDLQHMGCWITPTQRNESTDWKGFFDKVGVVTARILAVDPTSKTIRLSMQPHILHNRPVTSDLQVGSVIKDATVVRLDPGVGALLALPELLKEESLPTKWHKPLLASDEALEAARVQTAYVHISKAMDEKRTSEVSFAKEFAPSTTHTVRLLSTHHWIDGIASAAAAPSVVSAHVLTHADLTPGRVFKQVPVAKQLDSGGVLVDFGMGIRGLIPPMHLFDSASSEGDNHYRSKLVKVKYAVGAKVDVRVLRVDIHNKRCILTAKKPLVKSTSVITSYDQVNVGTTSTGFVSRVDDEGLAVTFFGNVYGRVTARSLTAELGVQNHKEDYHVGDVVHSRVVHIKKRLLTSKDDDDEMEVDDDEDNEEDRRYFKQLILSLRSTSDETADPARLEDEAAEAKASSKMLHLRAGAILPAKCMRIVELVPGKEKDEGFVSGYAIVGIKSKYLVDKDEAVSALPYIECKLPYDQLLDQYDAADVKSAATLDALAEGLLTKGKKIDRKGLVMTDPKKSKSEYTVGSGRLTVVSIRPELVESAEAQSTSDLLLPRPDRPLYVGALVRGYVAHLDQRYGAFVRFLDGLTGLYPKLKGGLHLPLFSTITTRVLAVDVTKTPPKILLGKATEKVVKQASNSDTVSVDIKAGDVIKKAKVVKVDFNRASLEIMDPRWADSGQIRTRLHSTMAKCQAIKLDELKKIPDQLEEDELSELHPFQGMEVGSILSKLHVVSVETRRKEVFVEVTNRDIAAEKHDVFLDNADQASPGFATSGIVISVDKGRGLWLQLSPGVQAHVPALEICRDTDVLNNLDLYFPRGARVEGVVINHGTSKTGKGKKSVPIVSLLSRSADIEQPQSGDVVVGRINHGLHMVSGPALMLDLRGGVKGRCCVTELDEVDEWINMPMGRYHIDRRTTSTKAIDQMDTDDGEEEDDDSEVEEDASFGHAVFVQCRVLRRYPTDKQLFEVSLRPSRIDGDLEDDEPPAEGDTVQGYVVGTNKKGCFLRFARNIEGRVVLKELSDGFIHDPSTMFPPGRLVVGKVKKVRTGQHDKTILDLDMRESVLMDSDEKLEFRTIQVGQKLKGMVTRIEDYGVFVRLENSDVSGLVHKSECSDKYVKKIGGLYNPGDLVKVLVVKKDDEKKQIGFSMKASHFMNDEESDDEASLMEEDEDDGSDSGLKEVSAVDSDDEIQAAKEGEDAGTDSESTSSGGSSDDDEEEDSDDDGGEGAQGTDHHLDTNVGFDWGNSSSDKKGAAGKDESSDEESGASDDSDDDDDAAEDDVVKSSHRSRRKQAQKRREEQEISQRETALADGTADENPQTAADFERLLTGNPNSSELWIRYMAFHLSVADIPAAREVANRSFERIEFRQEREKLNVWCALLTLEMKYGGDNAFKQAIDRACQHNNPKQVYLRVCEMMEKDSSTASNKVDEMYSKMCKKFKGKKKVWLAHACYLLKNGRHEEGHQLSKRALLSLPQYKHVETMTKYAQLVYEYGSTDSARTLFDGLLTKCPKRLDLLFVYVDKEVKHGDVKVARSLFERLANPQDGLNMKLSDKQMKKFFKKWYSFEEANGDEETQERVKDAARAYVERTSRD